MKSITQQLAEMAQGLIKLQPEVSQPDGFYQCFDSGGVECQVGEFLYGMMRIMQPEQVLTTGIYTGISDMYIAQALKDNGHGASTAIEYEEHHINRAKELWSRVGVLDKITVVHGSSLEYQTDKKFDFIFLDTEPGIRFQELVKFYDNLKYGGYFGIHDLPRTLCQGNFNPDHPEIKSYPYGDVPEVMKQLIKEDKLRLFHFQTPRGITFFYKPSQEDYKV